MEAPEIVITEKQASGAEFSRVLEARDSRIPWRKWGPYLSERQWGTVREDYSDNGDAWSGSSANRTPARRSRTASIITS